MLQRLPDPLRTGLKRLQKLPDPLRTAGEKAPEMGNTKVGMTESEGHQNRWLGWWERSLEWVEEKGMGPEEKEGHVGWHWSRGFSLRFTGSIPMPAPTLLWC